MNEPAYTTFEDDIIDRIYLQEAVYKMPPELRKIFDRYKGGHTVDKEELDKLKLYFLFI